MSFSYSSFISNLIKLLSIWALLSVTTYITTASVSFVKNVEHRQQKLCLLDSVCFNCSFQVEQHLLIEQNKLLQQQIEKNKMVSIVEENNSQQQLQLLNESPTVSPDVVHICSTPQYTSMQQYCCQLWDAFDCRTKVASEVCSYLSYVKYRRNLLQWANDLMLLNVCTEFDYNSKQCQEVQEQELKHEDTSLDDLLRQSQRNETNSD